jgi:hypothetical protein
VDAAAAVAVRAAKARATSATEHGGRAASGPPFLSIPRKG